MDARSDAYIRSITSGARFLHADFGGGGAYGIPFRVVPRTQRRDTRFVDYADESDPGPYPIPLNAPGSDRHVLVLQRGTCLFEMFNARRSGAG